MSELYRISYISKNIIDESSLGLEQQIKNILVTARRNNRQSGVTGALLYSGGFFCQVIEGTKEDLDKVFANILADTRHTDIIVLSNDLVSKRLFSAWDMAFAGFEDKVRFNIADMKNSKNDIELEKNGKALISILESTVVHNEILTGLKTSLSSLA